MIYLGDKSEAESLFHLTMDMLKDHKSGHVDQFMKEHLLKNIACLGFPITRPAPGLGFDDSPKPISCARAHTRTSPDQAFHGQVFVCIPSNLGVCAIQDLRVAGETQLVGAGPVPAEMFSPLSFGSSMNLDPAKPTDIVEIDFLNMSKLKGITFRSVILGLTKH